MPCRTSWVTSLLPVLALALAAWLVGPATLAAALPGNEELPPASADDVGSGAADNWSTAMGPLPPEGHCEDLPARERALCHMLGGWPIAAETSGDGAAGEPSEELLAGDGDGLIGTNFAISAYADSVSNTESLDKSSMAYNPARNESLVVWHAMTRETSQDIYGRFISASGVPTGAIFPINTDAGIQIGASVAFDAAASQYWVTWSDFGTGSTANVRLQRVSTTGTLLGGVITVNGPGPLALASRVACGAGRCLVVWTNVPDTTNSHILVRSYDSSGNPATTVLLISDAVGVSEYPDIAFNASDSNFLVVWEQAIGSTWDVIGMGVTKDIAVFPKITISSASGNQQGPRVAYSAGAGCYLTVWYDGRNTQNWDIYGQRVSRTFALTGGNIAIHQGSYNDLNPAVAGLDTTSQFAVAFHTDLNGGGLLQIHARMVSGVGGVGVDIPVREWNNQHTNPSVVARTASNSYLVAYTDNSMMTQPDIYAQALTTSSATSGGIIVVARGRKGQELPTLASSPGHGEYLAAWMDYRKGSDYQIYARRVTTAGTLSSAEIPLGNEATTILYGSPDVAYNSKADEYLVVWHEIPDQSTGYDIYARRVGWGGDLRGIPFLVSRDSHAGNEGSARVVYNAATDNYFVVWQAYTSGLWRVWGQRVSAVGGLLGSGFTVSASTGWAGLPKLAVNTTANEYLVVWRDTRSTRLDVYGQRVSGTGALIGSNLPLATGAGDKPGYAVAWSAAANSYLLVWDDARTGNNIAGQHLDAAGAFVGADFPIASTTVSEITPAVAYDAKHQGFLVTWQQWGDATDWDIWARRVPQVGTPTNAAFAVCTAPQIQSFVELASDSASGQLLLTWEDFRNGSYDIYGQRWAEVDCSFSIAPTSQSVSGDGGTGTVTVTATKTGCPWTATSNASWITVTGGATGTGNGTVSFSVAANTGPARSGTVTIAGRTFTVSQAAPVAEFTIAVQPTSVSVAQGTSATATVTTTVTPIFVAPIVLTSSGLPGGVTGVFAPSTIPSPGAGSATLTLAASTAATPGTYTVTITGTWAALSHSTTLTLTVTAAPCTFSISPTSASYASSGGTGTVAVTVTSGSGCTWTASSGASWITISSGASGTGSGTVAYSVAANAGVARTGTMTIAGLSLTVTQAAGSSLPLGHWLAVVLHRDVPSRNAKWRSDIAVLNRSSQAAALEIRLYASTGVLKKTFSLAGNAQLVLTDVVGQLTSAAEAGALEVRSDQDIFLTGRTYNQEDATHTYGQDFVGESSDLLLEASQSAWMPQLAQGTLYRTNIGITNTGPVNASVTLALFDGLGNMVWTNTKTYAPGVFAQYDQPFNNVGGIDQGYARVTVNSGSGIMAYASVVDQNTGDPTTINMMR